MKSLAVLVLVSVAGLWSVHAGSDLTIAQIFFPWVVPFLFKKEADQFETEFWKGESTLVNEAYFKMFPQDTLHASCFAALCKCGSEPYSGYISEIHDRSCDTHRYNEAAKLINECTNKKDCFKKFIKEDADLFQQLPYLIDNFQLNATSCTYYLSTCYGYLLNVAVRQYAKYKP